MPRRALLTSLAAVSLLFVAAFGSVVQAKSDHRTVQVLDNCDPATFNLALNNPTACVRPGGGITFDKFRERLIADGEVKAWRFSPSQLKIAAGGVITANNRGGVTHTFTEVAAYGGSCSAFINGLLGTTPLPECAAGGVAATSILAGESRATPALPAGTHLFQCLIHPWQRTTVQAG
jgi:plastocyanin